MRLDRLRGTDYAAPVDELLMRLPDRRALLGGAGTNLFNDFDALLVATPNPLDPSVTFVAARHHMDEAKLRSVLNQGAKASDHALSWRTRGGRPIAERRPRAGGDPEGRDDRLILLATPRLAVLASPVYVKLLLAPPAAQPAQPGAEPDGGVAVEPPSETAKPAWGSLLARIDAEEGLMPPDGAVMVNVVDMLKSRAPAPASRRCSTAWRCLRR